MALVGVCAGMAFTLPQSITADQRNRPYGHVDIDDYRAKGDGISDDKESLVSAMRDGLGITGGIVSLSCGKNYRFSSLPLQPRVLVEGCYETLPAISETVPSAVQANYPDYGKVLLDSSGTISCAAQAGLRGLFIQRTGMSIPSPDASAYAGTAITCSGVDGHGSSKSVGFSLADVMLVGFRQCIDSSSAPNAGNFFVDKVGCDAINGAEFHNSYDTTRIAYFHKFPYGTETYPGAPVLTRTGFGLKTSGNSDGLTILDALDLGSAIGFDFESAGNLMIGKIWGDYEVKVGLRIKGSSNVQIEQAHIVSTGSVGRGLGRAVQILGSQVHFMDGFLLGATDLCMEIANSTVDVGQMTMQNCGGNPGANNHSIFVDDTTSRLSGFFHFMKTNPAIPSNPPIAMPVGATTAQYRFARFDLNAGDIFRSAGARQTAVGWPNGTDIFDGGKPEWPRLASAAIIALPTLSDDYTVTGKIPIATLYPCSSADRQLRLLLPRDEKITDNGNIALSEHGKSFVGPGVLRLTCDVAAGLWRQ